MNVLISLLSAYLGRRLFFLYSVDCLLCPFHFFSVPSVSDGSEPQPIRSYSVCFYSYSIQFLRIRSPG